MLEIDRKRKKLGVDQYLADYEHNTKKVRSPHPLPAHRRESVVFELV